MLIYKDCIEESEGLQYTCDPCDIAEGGGIRSLCLIKKGTTIPNPYTQLDIDILVGAGELFVMAETRGSFDGGTPKMVTGYGDNKERQLGNDYLLQVKDPNFADNYDFWGAVENQIDWNVAFRTETQLAVVYEDCTITTKAPAEEGIDTDVVWDIEVKWYSKNKPLIQPYIKGIFDKILKTLNVIYGGTLATGGAYSMILSTGVVGHIRLPNGTVVTDTDGEIIGTNANAGGKITYYHPINYPLTVRIDDSDLAGVITANCSNPLQLSYITLLTGVIAKNSSTIDVTGCGSLIDLQLSKSASIVLAEDCDLYPKAIGDILYNAFIEETADVVFDFSGGLNASFSGINNYLTDTYTLALEDVLTALRANSGDITINGEV